MLYHLPWQFTKAALKAGAMMAELSSRIFDEAEKQIIAKSLRMLGGDNLEEPKINTAQWIQNNGKQLEENIHKELHKKFERSTKKEPDMRYLTRYSSASQPGDGYNINISDSSGKILGKTYLKDETSSKHLDCLACLVNLFLTFYITTKLTKQLTVQKRLILPITDESLDCLGKQKIPLSEYDDTVLNNSISTYNASIAALRADGYLVPEISKQEAILTDKNWIDIEKALIKQRNFLIAVLEKYRDTIVQFKQQSEKRREDNILEIEFALNILGICKLSGINPGHKSGMMKRLSNYGMSGRKSLISTMPRK